MKTDTSLDVFGRFKNASLQEEFLLHCTQQRSKFSFVVITALILSWIVAETVASTSFYDQYSGSEQVANEFYGTICLALAFIGLILLTILSFSLFNFKNPLMYSYLQVIFIFCINLIFILKEVKYIHLPTPFCFPADFDELISKKLMSNLSPEKFSTLESILLDANLPPVCPGKDSFLTLVNYQAVLVMLTTFQLLTSILYEPRLYLLFMCHIPTTAVMLYTMYYSVFTLFPLVVGSLGIDALLIHLHFQRVQSFLHQRKVQQLLEENERNADENNALELRSMIANVAHDLKTPLASFTHGLELINELTVTTYQKLSKCDKIDDTKVFAECFSSIQACIANISNTNAFMLMTINRCIDYTKASKGMKLVPKYETVNLREALKFPIECMSNIQERIGIKLEPLSEEICSHIITDNQWLQENLLCLLSNAVKYSAEGNVTVAGSLTTILHTTEKKSEGSNFSLLGFNKVSPLPSNTSPSSFLLFEVEDSGIGLSEEAMKNLFNPFKQAQRLAGGTGLGLYSLAMRMEALKGNYGVKKRDDGKQGSLFWFAIPYKPDAFASANDGKSVKPLLSPLRNSLRRSQVFFGESIKSGYEILIVDDSPSILKMSSLMLKRQGHQIWTAENGEIALKRIEEKWRESGKGFDLVLMDLQMPVMDGLEATRRLRMMEAEGRDWMIYNDQKNLSQQLIIGLSANSDHETSSEAIAVGMNDFFCKPFSLETFNKTIIKYLHE